MKCQVCNEENLTTETRVDPYTREIHQEDIHMDLCDDCWEKRLVRHDN